MVFGFHISISKINIFPNHTHCLYFSALFIPPNLPTIFYILGFPTGSPVKTLPAMQEPQETQVLSLDGEDSLEEGNATRSNILAWDTSWIEEPDDLQSMG